MKSILLLGNYRPTLILGRRLSALGYRVIITRGGGDGASEFSRHVSECWDHPPIEDEAAFFGALREFLISRPDIQIIMPVWEACVIGLARHQHELPADRIYATPSSDIVTACLDKTAMLSLATQSKVPCAQYAFVQTWEALTDNAEKIGFPLVIRPLASSIPIFGQKALICRTREELRQAMPAWPAEHETLIVQQYVQGPRYNVYFAAQKGRPVRMLEAKILRTHLPNGTGLAVDGVTLDLDEDIEQATRSLISALNYTGVGCVQFIVDRDRDRITFVEINPRIAGNHAVAEACDMELSRLAVDLAINEDQVEELRIGRAGARYVWTFGDLGGLRMALRERQVGVAGFVRELTRICWLAVRADIHMTWDWRDPLPTAAVFARRVPIASALVPTRYKRARAGTVSS